MRSPCALAERVFPRSYAESRAALHALASQRGVDVISIPHPLPGPEGEPLALDWLRLGPACASRVLVVSSATHGVEGFCGAGVQAALLAPGTVELPPDTALVLMHAVNPWGFAWLRRTDADNVDLNRNFLPAGAALPRNPAYDEVHSWLVPADWDGAARRAADEALAQYAATRGASRLQAAVTGGQFEHADGLFYGGRTASWSNHAWRRAMQSAAGRARRVAVIDIHTGLGARGACELISGAADDPAAARRARAWFGGEIVFPGVSATAAAARGYMSAALPAVLPHVATAMVVAEFGTVPFARILQTLRADNWVHARGERDSALWRAVKAEQYVAFVGEDRQWREAVLGRALDLCRHTLHALAAGRLEDDEVNVREAVDAADDSARA